jgi:hypothetical protein
VQVGFPRVARNITLRLASAVGMLGLLLSITSCRSPGITVQIVNQTPGGIRSIEVVYPGGSYGIAHLVRGNSYAKWIVPTADAMLKISYLDAGGQSHKIEKVMVKRGYSGGLAIVLLPENQIKVEDHTARPH